MLLHVSSAVSPRAQAWPSREVSSTCGIWYLSVLEVATSSAIFPA